MKAIQIAGLSIALITLVASIASAQTQADLQEAQNQFLGCNSNLEYSGSYNEFFRHVTTPQHPDATLEQLADSGFVLPSEVKIVLAWHQAAQECRNVFALALAWIVPSYVPIYKALWSTRDAIMVDVIQRRLSWGDALRRIVQADQIAGRQLGADYTRRLAAADAAASQEEDNELARNQALMRMGQQLMRSGFGNSPPTTICNRLGTSVVCNTR